ncbi:MAG: endonuclease/exonuclease/phosphatase family protein, partial [Chitinispirillales bacterium]|nr:endonuclease/exonuclease/phosphatase family protein [Chitinispirillales bacterium]
VILAVAVSAIAVAVAIFALCFYRADNGGGAVRPDKISIPASDAPLPDTISVAFYNVENLFDFNLDGTEYDEYKPGWFGWTEEMQRKKLLSVAGVVAAIGADVIGLCEIENLSALAELQGALDRMGAPYPYLAVAEAKGSATVTAILSKFPIRGKAAHPVERSRSILEASIARGGDEIRVFVNHWPSKRHPESRRVEAAEVLRRRVDALPAGSDYIIMGDLNSNHDEFASFHTQGFNDTRGRTGINHVLKTVSSGAHPKSPERFICKGELADCGGCHYNLWMDIDEDKRMSYVYRGAKQTIDNMLVPPALFDTVGYSYLNGSFDIFTWGGRLLRDGVPYRWQMVFKGKQKYHRGEGYSDHLPIRAKFVKAKTLSMGDVSGDTCESIDPALSIGDFAASVDGWVSGDSKFTVGRDAGFAKSGRRSLRVSGMHETENRTAARARLESTPSQKRLTLSIRGAGNLSIRLRRPTEKWVYYNAPDFGQSKSAKYKVWKSSQWVPLSLPLPPLAAAPPLGINGVDGNNGHNSNDVEIEIRSGKGEALSVWIDRVRLE